MSLDYRPNNLAFYTTWWLTSNSSPTDNLPSQNSLKEPSNHHQSVIEYFFLSRKNLSNKIIFRKLNKTICQPIVVCQ